MNIYIRQCNDLEVTKVEAQWRQEGFRLVSKMNEKDLLPMEYIKTSYSEDLNSTDDPRSWTLTRRYAD